MEEAKNYDTWSMLVALESLQADIAILEKKEKILKAGILAQYKERVDLAYKAKGEPFGVIHFEEESLKVSFTVKKEVSWDQKGLKDLFAAGAPVSIEYNVPEAIFKAQDDEGKAAFMPYRTVKPGNVSLKIERKE